MTVLHVGGTAITVLLGLMYLIDLELARRAMLGGRRVEAERSRQLALVTLLLGAAVFWITWHA